MPRASRMFQSSAPTVAVAQITHLDLEVAGNAVAAALPIARGMWTYVLAQANRHRAATPAAAIWGSPENVTRRQALANMLSGRQLRGACLHFAAFAAALNPPLAFAPLNRQQNSPLGWLDCLLLAHHALANHQDGAAAGALRAQAQAFIAADPALGPAAPSDGMATVPPTAASIVLARAALAACRREVFPRPHHAVLRARLLAVGGNVELLAAAMHDHASLETEYRIMLMEYIMSYAVIAMAQPALPPPPPVTVACSICSNTVVDHSLVVPYTPYAGVPAAVIAALPVCLSCVATCLTSQTDATITTQSACWDGTLAYWVAEQFRRECASCKDVVWRTAVDPCPRTICAPCLPSFVTLLVTQSRGAVTNLHSVRAGDFFEECLDMHVPPHAPARPARVPVPIAAAAAAGAAPGVRQYCDCCYAGVRPGCALTGDAAMTPHAAGGVTLLCAECRSEALTHARAANNPIARWSHALMYLDTQRAHDVPIPGVEAAMHARLGTKPIAPAAAAAAAVDVPQRVHAIDSVHRRRFPLRVPAASTLPADELLRAILAAERMPPGARRQRALTAAEDALDDATEAALETTGPDSACSSAGMRWRAQFQLMTGHKREVLEAKELYACELAFRDALAQDLPAQTRARLVRG